MSCNLNILTNPKTRHSERETLAITYSVFCYKTILILFVQCQTIVEDNEDDFLSVLAKENQNPVDEICVDRTDICKEALRDEL